MTLTFTQGHRDARKQKHKQKPIISQGFEWILIKFGALLRFCGLMNLMLILSRLISILWREPNLGDSVKLFSLDLHSDIYRSISVKLDVMIEATKLYTMIEIWKKNVLSIQGHSYMRQQKLLRSFTRRMLCPYG